MTNLLAENATELQISVGQLLGFLAIFIGACAAVAGYLIKFLVGSQHSLAEVEKNVALHGLRIEAVEKDMSMIRKRTHDILSEMQAMNLNLALIGQKLEVTELKQYTSPHDEDVS
jgi:hypothetical protein